MTRKVVSPIALDKSINTTEQTPRNIADVLAQQLDGIKTAIETGNGNLEAAFVCYYGVTTATQIKEAIEDGKVPYFYYNGVVAQLWKVETNKYTFRTTNTRSVEGQTILDVVDYVVNGSVWSTVTREVSGGSSSGQSYIASVNSLADFDTTGKSGMQDLISVVNVPADGVYQLSVLLHITPKAANDTKSDLVLQFTSSDNTGWPSHTFHAVVDDSQTFAQQLSFSTSVSLKAGENTLRIQCDGLNTEYLVFVDELTVAQLVNGVYHNGDDFADVHTLTEAADFNNDDGVLVDGATGGPRFMLWQTLANKVLGFIKSLSTTITAFRTGDVIAVDGPDGTAKMSKDDLLKETAENALVDNLAPAFDPEHGGPDNDGNYPAGYSVIYEGKLYTFKVDHSGAWNAADVEADVVTTKKEFIGILKEISKSEIYQTRCYYNNSGSLTVSAQISSNVFYAAEVYYIETVALDSGAAPAILWYNSEELVSANLISIEYGTKTLATNRVLFARKVTPPAGAVKCVVNCYNDYIGYCHVVNKVNKLTKVLPKTQRFFNQFTNVKSGAAFVTGSTFYEDTSEQFRHVRINIDDVESVTTVCQNGTNGRSILCFKGTETNYSNYLGVIASVDAFDSLHPTLGKITLNKDRLPYGTTHVIVNISTQVVLSDDVGYYTTRKHNVVKTTLRDNLRGLITYDGNDVAITQNFNWSYNVVPVDRLGAVHTYSGGRSDILPILYFDSEELTTEHYVGSVAGDENIGILDIVDYAVPASAKYAVITSNRNHSEEVYFNFDRLDIGDYAEVGTGKDFETITSAIDSLHDDFEIRLNDGVYEENVSVWNGSVFLKGSSPDNCKIVSYSGLYVDTTVEMICGRLENITVAAEYKNGVSHEVVDENGAYALHIEYHAMAVDFAVGKKLELVNCVFISDFAPGVGCGALSGWKLICRDCRFVTRQVTGRGNYYAQGGLGGFYMHDQNSSAYTTKAKLEMVDCSCESENLANAVTITDNDLRDGRGVDATFQRVILSSTTGHDNNIWWRGEIGFTGCWSNSYTSAMNSDVQLNG